MKLIPADRHVPRLERPNILELANDADPGNVPLEGIRRIDLHFPVFTDGRAYSQAYLLRRRRGFQGEIRATGEVLADQLPLMERSGFSAAVLRADQDLAVARRQLAHLDVHYQGDALHPLPRFLKAL